MSHHGKTSTPKHEDAGLVRIRAQFVEWFGDAEAERRATAIATLPRVEWRGRTLYTIRCLGDFGHGPHDMHVPASLLWSLINVHHFFCPYHR